MPQRPFPPPPEGARLPRKQFGQHFLTDPNILGKIIRAADLRPRQVVLEIGPGRGHLTQALADAGARVVAVEVDRDLVPDLRRDLANSPGITILEGNVLSAPPAEWLARAGREPPYVVVANLPYYITGAILRYLLEADPPPERLVVMVQKEVARQIAASPPHMNLLAVSVQYYGRPRVVEAVPAGAFFPRPKVDSAVVRIDVLPPRGGVDAAGLFGLVRAGFGTRRKQLRNALANGLGGTPDAAAALLHRAGIDATRRAETLSLEEWSALYRAWSANLKTR